jgi:AcrR family transcriptional regulator
MSTREDDSEQPRGAERILRAAIDVIAERGFRGAATSEIARRAGVAEGTIFRHFKTKDLLLRHIVEPFVKHVLAPIALRGTGQLLDVDYPSFPEFLRAVAYNRLQVARDHIPVLRIVAQELPLNPELRAMAIRHVGGQLIPELLRVIRRHQDRGELAREPPEAILRLVLSTFGGYFATRFLILPDRAWDDDAEIERMIRFITRGLAPA